MLYPKQEIKANDDNLTFKEKLDYLKIGLLNLFRAFRSMNSLSLYVIEKFHF